jgi:hypothetical protein
MFGTEAASRSSARGARRSVERKSSTDDQMGLAGMRFARKASQIEQTHVQPSSTSRPRVVSGPPPRRTRALHRRGRHIGRWHCPGSCAVIALSSHGTHVCPLAQSALTRQFFRTFRCRRRGRCT